MANNGLTLQPYVPQNRPQNLNVLLSNHFQLIIDGFPELTFFAQSMQIPSVSAQGVTRQTPFRGIKEVSDHLEFAPFTVNYRIDNAFKTYFSLYYWMSGYGHPRSFEEIQQFRQERAARTPNPRPTIRELEKTTAVLHILQPDTNSILVTIVFEDIFPMSLGSLQLESTDSEPVELKCEVQFATNGFDVILPA